MEWADLNIHEIKMIKRIDRMGSKCWSSKPPKTLFSLLDKELVIPIGFGQSNYRLTNKAKLMLQS